MGHEAPPAGLPVPDDDGAAARVVGMTLPEITLTASSGRCVKLTDLGPGRTVIHLYPLTGRPGVDMPEGWDVIPGARGCTSEACDFRDHFTELLAAGAARVFGLSSQTPAYQDEVVVRLRLPFEMLSDEHLVLGRLLGLPTLAADLPDQLYSRLTMVVKGGVIEHVFYPVFPPNQHAEQVLAHLTANRT